MFVTGIVVFFLLCQLVANEPLYQLSDEYIKLINKEGKWRAGRNFPADTPIDYLRNLMGLRVDIDELKNLPAVVHDPEVIQNLPESFDAREQWPECPSLKEIRDQGQCGACWAVSAVSAITDRVCIYSNGTKNFHFSAEDALTCSSFGGACTGGGLPETWSQWVDEGIVSGGNYNSHEGCKPYTFPRCKNHMKSCSKYKKTPACVRACENGYNTTYEKDKKLGKKIYGAFDETGIMAEVQQHGPVTATFSVYADFANYKGGVYQYSNKSSEFIGSHAVKIIGWGVEEGTKYWLIANSWGTDFGDNGYFKTMRGAGYFIEAIGVAGEPRLDDYENDDDYDYDY